MTTLTVCVEEYGGDDGWTLVRSAGEIDLVSGHRLREEVHAAVSAGSRRILLDLTEVNFCDSSGVGVLIAARRLLRSCGGELRLVLPAENDPVHAVRSAPVHRVFAALGVRRLFVIHPTLEAALAAPAPADLPDLPAPLSEEDDEGHR